MKIKKSKYFIEARGNYQIYSTEEIKLNPTQKLSDLVKHLGFKSNISHSNVLDSISKKAIIKHWAYDGEQTIIDPISEILNKLVSAKKHNKIQINQPFF